MMEMNQEELNALISSVSKKVVDDLFKQYPSKTNFVQKTSKQDVLKYVVDNGYVISTEVAKVFGVAKKTANGHLNTLVDEGLLRKVGITKSGKYVMLFYYDA